MRGHVGALSPGASWTQFLSSPGMVSLRPGDGTSFSLHAEFLLPCPHACIGFPVVYTASLSYLAFCFQLHARLGEALPWL